MSKIFFHLIEKKGAGKLCALIAMMFFGALMEMVGISLIAGLCSFLAAPAGASPGGFLGWLYGLLATPEGGGASLTALLTALIFLYLFKMAYLMAEQYVMARYVRSFQHGIASELYEGFLRGPYAVFTQLGSANIITLLNTDTSRAAGYVNAFLQMVTELLVLFCLSGLLLAVDPEMTLFLLAGIGLALLLILCGIRRLAYETGLTLRSASARRMKWLNQGIRGAKDVKVAQAEDFFCRMYEREDLAVAGAVATNQLLTRAPGYCIEAVLVCSVLIYLLVVMRTGRSAADFVPSLSALGLSALRLLPTFNRIQANLTQMNNYKSSLETVAAALDRARARQKELNKAGQRQVSLEKEIAARELSFQYEGRTERVLKNVSVRVPIGSFVGIEGPSGAGKTTLADLLLGLLQPQEGGVYADGEPVQDCLDSFLRGIAYIPQTTFLLDGTVRENVAFGQVQSRVRDGQVWEALEKAALAEFVRSLPQGLDTQVGDGGIRLSGGERQRLGIARALYQGCSVLVFDEATSALDMETEEAVLHAIRALRKEKTLIVISHRASALRGCDLLYRVEGGGVRLIPQEEADQLLRRPEGEEEDLPL